MKHSYIILDLMSLEKDARIQIYTYGPMTIYSCTNICLWSYDNLLMYKYILMVLWTSCTCLTLARKASVMS